jgi:hypothetical protein
MRRPYNERVAESKSWSTFPFMEITENGNDAITITDLSHARATYCTTVSYVPIGPHLGLIVPTHSGLGINVINVDQRLSSASDNAFFPTLFRVFPFPLLVT